ncbi:hypothetical protein FDENT_1186 [Fusarium denticulatum]|uniref:CHAT domain-containing protein n=1 Tax=Fusarium denticulatum TaxID=48507 RepID=A0A8H5XJ59_9HYPO|nr:hypothetical protein FDENT_1186 [Fusarium denticulatum]
MSDHQDSPAERLRLKRSRLKRELEHYKMLEVSALEKEVSSLEEEVETFRKRFKTSEEHPDSYHDLLPGPEERISSPKDNSIEQAQEEELEISLGCEAQEENITRSTGLEVLSPEVIHGDVTAVCRPAPRSIPATNAIANHRHNDRQSSRLLSFLPQQLITARRDPALALEYFTGPLPLDSTEKVFLGQELEDLQNATATFDEEDPGSWKLLGFIHYMIYKKTQSIEHIDMAIEKTERARKAFPEDSVEYWGILKRLIMMLADAFESPERGDKLDKAINYGDEMIIITKPYHIDRDAIILDIYKIKTRHAVEHRSEDEFQEAIFTARMAMDANQIWDENHDLDQESTRHFELFAQTSSLEDLNRAIELAENAVTLTADYYIHKPGRLSDLARYLVARYGETNDIQDLHKAIDRGEEAIASAPSDYKFRAELLANSVGFHECRLALQGNPEDLRLINIRAQEAIALMAKKEDPEIWKLMGTLSSCFLLRYQQVKDPQDLATATQWIKEALKLDSPENPVGAMIWNTAAAAFLRKFEHENRAEDLEEAIQMSDKAVNAPRESILSDQTAFLGNVAAVYATAFDHLRDKKYLDLSIEKGKLALGEMATHDFKSSMIRSNLAMQLSSRFELEGNFKDMEDAVYHGEKAIELSSPAGPLRALWLHNLASCLELRDGQAMGSNNKGSSERVADLWVEAARLDAAPPRDRIRYALKAFEALMSLRLFERAVNVISDAVTLLSAAAPRQMAQLDQQSSLESFDGVTTLAVSAVIDKHYPGEEKAYKAVALLEFGRGVITGFRFGMRPDLNALREGHPALAAKFEQLRDKLESPINDWLTSGFTNGGSALQHEMSDRHELSSRLDDVVKEIRLLNGFQRFQLPPSSNELMDTASSGPIVIINVSMVRSDALLVRSNRIESLHLPNLRHSDIVQRVDDVKALRHLHQLSTRAKASMSGVLEWLWDVAVGPILDYLGYKDTPQGEWPRIWWIPTGPLTLLPLHAAGYHSPPSNKSALDRVVSSYSSSIKALQYSRRMRQKNSRSLIDRPALLVSMPTTPDQPSLHFAKKEVDELHNLLPAEMKRSRLSLPTTQETVDGLANCSIFHFAGHGESHQVNPSQSLLLTSDWKENPLTVEKLFSLNLRDNSPCLAYLSACSTNDNNAEKLHDESIHLVTAYQLAGFQHVVGTMWEVADEYCVDAARGVYQEMMSDYDGTIDGAKISLGVHKAVRHLRAISTGRRRARGAGEEGGKLANRGESQRTVRPWESEGEVQTGENDPLVWAAYLHIGS